MLDGVPAELLSNLGPAALLSLAVGLTLFGRLVPGRTVDRLLADKDRLLADKDKQVADWRETARLEAERGRIQAGQVTELLELAHTTNALIAGLSTAARRSDAA